MNMRCRKHMSVFLLFTAFILCLTACGSAMYNRKASDEVADQGSAYYPRLEEGSESDTSSAAAVKMIRSADMSVECEKVGEAYNGILGFVLENGGFEGSCVSDYNQYEMVDAQLWIPADHFDALIAKIKSEGKSVSLQKHGSNVSETYADLKLRAEMKRASLENYKEILKKAVTMEDTIRVQQQIDEIVFEIERLESEIKDIDQRVAYSELRLQLRETSQPNVKGNKWKPMTAANLGNTMVGGFRGATDVLIMFLQWLVIVIVVLLPFVFIAGAVLLIVFLVLRRRKKRKVITITGTPLQNENLLEQFDRSDD